jgi:hypothetical protein
MQVNLRALEKSLAKIEEVGKDELTFEANGVELVLRPLLPDEEEIVDAFARVAYIAPLEEFDIEDLTPLKEEEEDKDKDGDEDETNPLDIVRHRIWLDRLRQATLGCAIIQIEGQDLRGMEYLETGEVDDNGNPISVLKRDWVRDMITKWTRPILTQMFGAFSELMDRINLKASKLVQFDAADINEELRRLKRRTLELERHKLMSENPVLRTVAENEETAQQQADGENQARTSQMDGLADHTVAQREAQREARRQEEQQRLETQAEGSQLPGPAPRPAPEQDHTQPPVRQSSIPQPQAHTPQQRQPPQDPNKIPEVYDGNSIYDPADGEDAIAAENARQEVLYRRKLQRDAAMKAKREAAEAAGAQAGQKTFIQGQARKPSAAPAGPVHTVGQPAPPPQSTQLREALNTQQAVPAQTAAPMQRGAPIPSTPKPSGKQGKVDVYRQPTTTLDRRGPPTELDKIQIDQGSTSRNPRFKPPREG